MLAPICRAFHVSATPALPQFRSRLSQPEPSSLGPAAPAQLWKGRSSEADGRPAPAHRAPD